MARPASAELTNELYVPKALFENRRGPKNLHNCISSHEPNLEDERSCYHHLHLEMNYVANRLNLPEIYLTKYV